MCDAHFNFYTHASQHGVQFWYLCVYTIYSNKLGIKLPQIHSNELLH